MNWLQVIVAETLPLVCADLYSNDTFLFPLSVSCLRTCMHKLHLNVTRSALNSVSFLETLWEKHFGGATLVLGIRFSTREDRAVR